MKRLITAIAILLVCLASVASAQFAIFQTYSVSGPVNMGGGSNLIERSLFSTNSPNLSYSQMYATPSNGSPDISTSNYYHLGGMIWSRPYDLDTMGSEGAAVKAANGGNRFVWLLWVDHSSNFPGTSDLYAAYSNDPQVLPDPTTMRALIGSQNTINIVDKLGQTQNNLFVYWSPFLVYNPDPGALAPFYIYAECQSTSSSRQHEICLVTTSDFQSVTFRGPAVPTTNFNGWTSLGRPTRLGVNSWEMFSLGKADATATTPAFYKYTSTDGWDWTPDYTNQVAGSGPFHSFGGNKYMLTKEYGDPYSYLSWLAVNSSNVSLGTYTRISTPFGSNGNDLTTSYPWQTYLQDLDTYEEDGVVSIYVARAFPLSNHDGTNDGPYLGNFPAIYPIDISGVTSGTMTVTVVPGGMPPLAIGFKVRGVGVITAFGTGSGGTGTYTVTGPNRSAGTYNVSTNGGLWHQFIDQYYYITDSTAAASAAPLGVKASCASGVATVQWNNSLPHHNYRVYQGTSAGTQATLVGDVTGTLITFTPPANQQTWIKVVTMNSGEQKNRVVNVYCSAQNAQVNKHINRVTNDGGSGIDIAFLASADAWLNSNNLYPSIQWWTDVRFGYKLDGSGFIAKIYDLGTTQLPKGGDYTPTTSNTYPSTSSNTSYSATSFRGTTPSWVNNASSARGYFGSGRANNIILWNEITLLAAYQKPGTAVATLFGHGENTGLYLRQASGASGDITFAMVCDKASPSVFTTATVPFVSATAAAVVAGKFDGVDMTAYLNGVAGTSVTVGSTCNNNSALLKDTVLRGQYSLDVSAAGTGPILMSGSQNTRFSYTARTYNPSNNEALFTGAGLAGFNKSLPDAQIQSWGTTFYN